MFNLGSALRDGVGVDADKAEAAKWLAAAAEAGVGLAAFSLAVS